jgi:hypothetical protein
MISKPAERPVLGRRVENPLREVLADLPAGQDAALLHLFLCPICHAGAVLRLKEEIDDPETDYSLVWLEGQVLARLGQAKKAELLLETARQRLIAEHRFPEVALCSLDLSVLLVAADRKAELTRLVQDIEETFAAEPALDATRRMARDFAETVAGLSEVPEGYVAEAAFTLRRVFRFHGYRVEPLPFV